MNDCDTGSFCLKFVTNIFAREPGIHFILPLFWTILLQSKLGTNMKCSNGQGVLLFLVLLSAVEAIAAGGLTRSGNSNGSEEWGYIEIRPSAHMFWWLYRSPARAAESWPLILWLQGGPGASGVGIGNFEEIGPLDTNLKPRNSTWLQKADLLFVDSPVGTGFSYVDNTTLVAKTDQEAAEDLLSFLKQFSATVTDLSNTSFFIVAESYGGKHATLLGLALSKAIAAGDIKVNLGGIVLGDSWISPVDFVKSWGPLLKAVSRLDASDANEVNRKAEKIQELVTRGEYLNATESWSELEDFIDDRSNGVDFYNFLLDGIDDPVSATAATLQSLKVGSPRHLLQYLSMKVNLGIMKSEGDFSSFMNGVIREKLKIIPEGVQWGGQSDLVFTALSKDFMKDVIEEVDELLGRGEKVTVYNGQVDLICATVGTEAWMQKLRWTALKEYNATKRQPLYCQETRGTKGFVKSHKNLHFFWILNAGHFVPLDQPCVALKMVEMIFQAATR